MQVKPVLETTTPDGEDLNWGKHSRRYSYNGHPADSNTLAWASDPGELRGHRANSPGLQWQHAPASPDGAEFHPNVNLYEDGMSMTIESTRGNIFHHDAEALVNTVNYAGVMSAGLARQFKERYPRVFDDYRYGWPGGGSGKALSPDVRRLPATLPAEIPHPGAIHPWQNPDPSDQCRWILNFAAKDHWRHPQPPGMDCRGTPNPAKRGPAPRH